MFSIGIIIGRGLGDEQLSDREWDELRRKAYDVVADAIAPAHLAFAATRRVPGEPEKYCVVFEREFPRDWAHTQRQMARRLWFLERPEVHTSQESARIRVVFGGTYSTAELRDV